ncbi:MAG: aminotransferase class III-fold pyridoxal phosphate-dependent enzyme [Bifidobacteriaceae bacterium]|jgi:taurine--2-oxoglutarate transaminase|nr:aminotransferase class III-fold pyridoxal phosphate-dependent enzyme [Bifidobacteriaceae bacterium]
MNPSEPLAGAALDSSIIDRDHAMVFGCWAAQASRPRLHVAGGRGAELWDHAGNRWIDFTSQLINANIGYGHPAVVEAIAQQAARLATISPATANEARAEAAAAILRHMPQGFNKIFFTNAGADAVENAIRLARLHTKRDKIISFYRSYHGNTAAAITATGDWRRVENEYARGHLHVFGPYLYRSEYWAETPEEEAQRAARHLRRVVEEEGPSTIAGFLFETIPGTNGILPPPPGYLPRLREIADEHGIVLILDEVMAGFARSGAWLALDHYGVTPDLVTFAKGVNSGYVPAGGVALSEAVASGFDHRVFPGGLTYSGHPLAMAAIVANIGAMEAEDVIGNAARVGAETFSPGLAAIAEANPLVGEVRGIGCFWAVELVQDAATRAPVKPGAVGRIVAACRERGLLIAGVQNRLHVTPPCVISAELASRGIAILREVLDDAVRESW